MVSAGGRQVEVMKYNHIGPKQRPDAIVVTYRLKKGGKPTLYKTLTLTGKNECNWYEWTTEAQALSEHDQAVAHYRRMS
jgi:hypothetical protein